MEQKYPKNWLILTQYFPPEIGAPQIRLSSMIEELKKHNINASVLTAMPNYPKMEIFVGYNGLSYKKEIIDGIKVHRSKIYVSKSKGVLKRLFNLDRKKPPRIAKRNVLAVRIISISPDAPCPGI